MKIDTSSYYPKSPLDDDESVDKGEERAFSASLFPETSTDSKTETDPEQEEHTPVEPAQHPEPVYDPTDTERALDGVATFLSWTLVPLLMPVYGALLAFNLSILNYMPFASKLTFTLIIAGVNVLIPSVMVLMLKRLGLVDDLGLNGRKERLIPYLITILCMGGTAFFMWSKGAPMWLVMFFVGGGVAGVINLIVNFRWKISAHSAGIAGIVALLIRILHDGMPQGDVFTWLIIWIAAAGLLGSARVWLGRHTAAQVLAGFAVGFLSVFFLTNIG